MLSANNKFRIMAVLVLLALVFGFANISPAHAASIVVNTLDDELNSDGDCSLREAITAANTNAAVDACTSGTPGADTISFNVTGTIISTLIPIDITEDLTFAGPGAANLTLTDDDTPPPDFPLTSHLMVVDTGVTLNLQDLTVANAGSIRNLGTLIVINSAFSGNISPMGNGSGGALQGGTVIVENSIFSGNNQGPQICTAGGPCGRGGAIFADAVTVTNSTFSDNSSGAGGAIYANAVTVMNSIFSGNSGLGGGIYNDGGLLTITDSTFTDNRAGGVDGNGGAIFNLGLLTVMGSTFTDNRAGDSGGAIFDGGTEELLIVDSIFSGNIASGLDGVDLDGGFHGGGAIFGRGVTVENSTFSGNRAIRVGDMGGAILADTVTVTNSTFAGNQASTVVSDVIVPGIPVSGMGGAIFIEEGDFLNVTDSTFSGNSAGFGGAISNTNGGVYVVGSTFSNNIATLRGGGIDNFIGLATVINSTFSGNRATGIAGLFNISGKGGAIFNDRTLNVSNSTFSGNSAEFGSGLFNDLGGAITLRNTIIANGLSGENCFVDPQSLIIDGGNSLQSPGQTCGDTIPTANPRLGPLADNGGPTLTLALLPGSPAIDAGNDATCATTDQRGIPRPQDGNGNGIAICDIGAFELEAAASPTPEELLNDLMTTVKESVATGDIPHGVGNALLSKLQTAQKKLESGQKNATVNALQAFIHLAEAQRGKRIPTTIADDLIAQAREIIQQLQQ